MQNNADPDQSAPEEVVQSGLYCLSFHLVF